MKIAIIGGSGKMGQWFARFLSGEGNDILILGRSREKLIDIRRRLGVDISSWTQDVAEADLVIISVPMDSFEDVVKEYGPHILPGRTVIELSSVKTNAVEAMHRHLKTQKVLGVHPMFGPGAKDFAGHNFILTPTNEIEGSLAQKVETYIKKRGGKVTVTTPEEHDRMMATVLGLPHFLALVAAQTLLELGDFDEFEKVGGTTCRLLLMFADSVLSEDPELYASLQMNLAGMPGLHDRFARNLSSWAKLVKNGDKEGFVKKMSELASQRAKSDPDYKRAYQNMYRTIER
jgi:prephenate dehydrogenase